MNQQYFSLDDNFDSIIEQNLDEKIISKRMIPTGWTNIVYEVETNNGNYFFRFPRDEFWSRTIVKDYEFAKYVYGKTNFNTIKLELCHDGNRPFSKHRKIEGTPLAEKMNELSDRDVKKVSKQIADFMNQLHKISYDKNKVFVIKNIGTNLTDFLDELLQVHVSDQDKKFWIKNQYEQSQNKCLVHGDLNSSNILLDNDNNITAIIDFGFGGFGNKYDDIARIIGRCPENFKNEIISSYESYSKYKLDSKELENNIQTWTNIDNAYINYMRKIGIYK